MSEHDKLCERPVTAKKYVKEWLNDGAQIAHLAAGIAETRWCRCAERLCCLCVFKGLTPPEATVIRKRHQGEDRAAIRALQTAGRVLSERLDEFEAALIGQRPGRVDADPDIFFFQETPESWEKMHALDSAQVDLDDAIQEHAAALQRAREGT